MNHDQDDRALRGRFDDLREADARGAPSFEHSYQGALRGAGRDAPPRFPPALRAAAAVVLLASGALAVALLRRPAQHPLGGRAVTAAAPSTSRPVTTDVALGSSTALSDWRSPTDFLLEPSPGVVESPPVAPDRF